MQHTITNWHDNQGHTLSHSILSALIAIAPNASEQRKLSSAYNEAKSADGEAGALNWAMSTLHDGMNYGNWPWTLKNTHLR